MEPFLRWAGGKRWLSPTLAPLIKEALRASGGVYGEPFLGSAAMFFGLSPQKAILSDTNVALINAYQQVSSAHLAIESLVRSWPVESDFYYDLRASEPTCAIERAARFIYLNRTCYGGLYRENSDGKFNTPYGGGSRTPAAMLRKRVLQKAHFALRNVTILSADFEEIISEASAGDVLYCDPTYSDVTRGAFDRYGSTVFQWRDQVRLALAAEAAMDRGTTLIISNGRFDELHELYPAAYRIRLQRRKAIGNRALQARRHEEYLLILDPLSRRSHWERLGSIENRKSTARYAARAAATPVADAKEQEVANSRKPKRILAA